MRSPFMRRILTAALLVFAGVWANACNKSDIGECCEVLPGNPATLPELEYRPGTPPSPIDNIKIDPGFNCDGLACVVYAGSPAAYCTQECEFDDNCPKGFSCLPVLESQACDEDHVTEEITDDCPPGAVTTKDKFCVKLSAHDCRTSD